MDRVMGGLIAGIGVNCGHITGLDAEIVVHHFGQRCEAVCRAGRIRHNHVLCGQIAVVHPINNCAIRIFAWCRDQNPFGTIVQMRGRFVARCENAGTFIGNIHPIPRQLFGIANGRQFDGLIANPQDITFDSDIRIQAPMHRVKLQQMRKRVRRRQIIDPRHGYILNVILDDRAQHVATDPAKAIDCDIQGHVRSPKAPDFLFCGRKGPTL